jgi:hypothetical protein
MGCGMLVVYLVVLWVGSEGGCEVSSDGSGQGEVESRVNMMVEGGGEGDGVGKGESNVINCVRFEVIEVVCLTVLVKTDLSVGPRRFC